MLPAPIIENTLPTIRLTDVNFEDYTGPAAQIKIKIPNQHHIDASTVHSMQIIVKTMTNAKQTILEKVYSKAEPFQFDSEQTIYSYQADNEFVFNLSSYYKIQVALTDTPNYYGPYSNVGIAYCNRMYELTTHFTPWIPEKEIMKVFPKQSISCYAKTKSFDPIKSYCFSITSGDHIIETSGNKLNNIGNDISETNSYNEVYLKSSHTWIPSTILNPQEIYTLNYTVTTINNNTSTISRSLAYNFNSEKIIFGEYKVIPYLDEGYVKLFLEINQSYHYLIVRSSNKDNYTQWTDLANFYIGKSGLYCFKDSTIEHGILYKYGLYVYDSQSISAMRLFTIADYGDNSGILPTKFEHIFLSDAEKQLCIKYNPKIASFKSTILENKVDTIGGKYPFIFRNNNVGYKEFSISGLISMTMDDNANFFKSNYTLDSYLKYNNNLINCTAPSDINSLQRVWGSGASIYSPSKNDPVGNNCIQLTCTSKEYNIDTIYLDDNINLQDGNYLESGDYVLSGWIQSHRGSNTITFALNNQTDKYEITPSLSWQYFYHKFTISKNIEKILTINIQSTMPNGSVVLGHLKLEKGVVPNTWTPSQSDIQQSGSLEFFNIGSVTNLTDYNICKEREFKMEVLNWLTNGKPKLFRSPTEGNYIVNTMNISLTPNDTLGRMLHTFNCTAYEIDECNIQNIKKHNLVQQELLTV